MALKAIAANDNLPELSGSDQENSSSSVELRVPLLAEESSFSNNIILDDSDSDDNSDVLFSVLQRRDNSTYEMEER